MKVDIAVIGGGVVGGSLACALAGSGLRLALAEPKAVRPLPAAGFDLRVYALNPRSMRFLERCGAWSRLVRERIAPVREMLVFGDDGASKLAFSAYRSGVPELAALVEESNLRQALAGALAGQANLAWLPGIEFKSAEWTDAQAVLSLSDGSSLEARLAVAADGADSRLRGAAGIAAKVHEYGQMGVVANFRSHRPHRDTAYQWFRNDGALALLPLPMNHVSMVWSTTDECARQLLAMTGDDLARAVEQAAPHGPGRLEPAGTAAAFPLRRMRAVRLIAPRIALVGDAAHNVHPLAGQGLNLGLGDAESLSDIVAGRGMEADCGAASLLRRFERSRREDILAMETVTDGLQKLFGTSLPGLSWLRNAGLHLTDRLPPLKRLLVKRALGQAA